MNIFRPKYRKIKEVLRAFGEQFKSLKSEACYSAAFWKEKLNGINDERTWDYVITSYLAYWCTDEERKFIDEVFFNDNSPVGVCARFHMGEAAYYCKREQVLTDIIGIALQCGMITIDIIRHQETAATLDNEIINQITEDKWATIEKLIAKTLGRKYGNIRNSVAAMLYIETNNLTWRDLPSEYGNWNNLYKRYIRWRNSGLWDKILEIKDFDE